MSTFHPICSVNLPTLLFNQITCTPIVTWRILFFRTFSTSGLMTYIPSRVRSFWPLVTWPGLWHPGAHISQRIIQEHFRPTMIFHTKIQVSSRGLGDLSSV